MKTVTIRAVSDDVSELLLYSVIGSDFFGEGVDAKSFREQIKAVKARVLNLRINSPGGSVTEGAAMLNALDEWRAKKGRTIEVDVDGLAASAASVVMMAGDVVRVAANALVMIHNPMTMTVGGAEDMRRAAELLDKSKEQLLDVYMRRAKLSRGEMSAAMDAETWYTGAEAVAAGLADSTGDAVRIAAFAGMPALLAKMKYRHPPELPSDAAAWAATEERKRIAAALLSPEDCGGKGGTPGPCPGEKGDKAGNKTPAKTPVEKAAQKVEKAKAAVQKAKDGLLKAKKDLADLKAAEKQQKAEARAAAGKAKAKAPVDAKKQLAETKALDDRYRDKSVKVSDIEKHVENLGKTTNKAQMLEVARGMGMVRSFKTKAEAQDAIRQKMIGRKGAWERPDA